MKNSVLIFKRQLYRELILNWRDPRQMIYACLFFVMILIFFPLTISADTTTLRGLAPGLIWVDLLFAFFLSSERLFQQDYDDGIIEQWLVSGYSMGVLVAAKVIVHWFINVIPMLVLCPLVGVFLNLSSHEIMMLMLSLLCGTPAILFLCALAAAFSTGLKQKGVLMALILFPLTIPIMIFGSGTLTAVMQGLPVQGYLALLLALSTIAIGFLPLAISAVVNMGFTE